MVPNAQSKLPAAKIGRKISQFQGEGTIDMKRRHTSLEQIHHVADGENDHRHEGEGSARFHDCEQSVEQHANKNQALLDLENLPQAGPDRVLPSRISDGQRNPRKSDAPPYRRPGRKSVTRRNLEERREQQNEVESLRCSQDDN
jgi:hypothetical protein